MVSGTEQKINGQFLCLWARIFFGWWIGNVPPDFAGFPHVDW